jgi:hypothetical protein
VTSAFGGQRSIQLSYGCRAGNLYASRGRSASGRNRGGGGALPDMLFLFSNRLGCIGSLAVSALATLLLLALLGVI